MIRKFHTRTTEASPGPTIDELAAAVPVPRAVVATERRLVGDRERADRVADEINLLREAGDRESYQYPTLRNGPMQRALREAEAIAAAVDHDIAAGRRELAKARGTYVRDVRAALEPRRAAAEAGVREAVEAL